ncbi:MAG: hypothetical protein HGA80_06700 [Candidatus Omnitrophica bacterium]|nr:hypothetical protein [Candidatus Omnitrophota bacterium]
MKRWAVVLVICGLLTVLGCSPTRYIYKEITADKDPYNSQVFQATMPQLLDAVEKTMLTKKLSIEAEDKTAGTLTAFRKFSRGYQTVVVVLQAKIISNCDNEQQLFLNGIQTTERNYVEDKTRFFLWLVPLPGGGGKQVTTSKETDVFIEDKEWYQDLFAEIQKVLPKQG